MKAWPRMASFRTPLTRTAARITRGAAVHHEVANREIIVVEMGFVVDLVHYRPPNQPQNPNPPR
jgi:hypothetical protein